MVSFLFGDLLSSLSEAASSGDLAVSRSGTFYNLDFGVFRRSSFDDNNLLSTSNERQGLNLSYPKPDDRLEGLSPRTGGEL